MESRCFKNTLDWSRPVDEKALTNFIAFTLHSRLLDYSEHIDHIRESHGDTIYTGSAGTLFFLLKFLKRHGSSPDGKESIRANLHAAEKLSKNISTILWNRVMMSHTSTSTSLKAKDLSFLCGKAGEAAVLAAHLHYTEPHGDGVKTKRVLQVFKDLSTCASQKVFTTDEILYGRAGLLLGIRWLQQVVPSVQKEAYFHQVSAALVQAIIQSGINMRQSVVGSVDHKHIPPLVFEWHESMYIGAAHGFAGIIQALLLNWQHVPNDQRLLVKETLDWLLSLECSNGNHPSSLRHDFESVGAIKLVHWCHGVPGFIPMLCTASQVLNDARYLQIAEQKAELVWKYGLLRKGWGLCHGVAGNAYCFLNLYQVTGKEEYLKKAQLFAMWLATDEGQEIIYMPDEPYGLFTGVAGALCFLDDLQNDPLSARFPFYT